MTFISHPAEDRKKIKAIFCYDIGAMNTAASCAYIKDGKVIGLKNIMLGDNEYTIRTELLIPREEAIVKSGVVPILAPSSNEVECCKETMHHVGNFKRFIPRSCMTSILDDTLQPAYLARKGGVAEVYTTFLKLMDEAVRDKVATGDYPHFRQWYCISSKYAESEFNELIDEEKAEKFRQWWDSPASKKERLYVLTYPAAWKDGKGYRLMTEVAKKLGWIVYFEHEVNAAMAHFLHSAQTSSELPSSYTLGKPLIVIDGGGHTIDQAYYRANKLDSLGLISCETCLIHPDLMSTAGTAIDEEASKFIKRCIMKECIRRSLPAEVFGTQNELDEEGIESNMSKKRQKFSPSEMGQLDDLMTPLSAEYSDEELWSRLINSPEGITFITGLRDYEKQWQTYIKTLSSSTVGRKTFYSKSICSIFHHRINMDMNQAKIFLQPSVNETVAGVVKVVKMVKQANQPRPKLLIFTGGMANIQPYRNEVEKKLKSMIGCQDWQCDLAPNNHNFSSGKPVALGGVLLGLSQQGCGDGIKRGVVPVHYGISIMKVKGDKSVSQYAGMSEKELHVYGLQHYKSPVTGNAYIKGFVGCILAKGSENTYNAAINFASDNQFESCSALGAKNFDVNLSICQSHHDKFPELAKEVDEAGIYYLRLEDKKDINELAQMETKNKKKFWRWRFSFIAFLLTANPAVGIKFTNKPE